MLHCNLSRFPADLFCMTEYAVLLRIYHAILLQGNFSCNSGTGKPSGIRNIFMCYLDCDHIFFIIIYKKICYIVTERHITVRSFSKIIAVDPDLAVLVNSIEA